MPPILPESWKRTAAQWLNAILPHTCLLCGCDDSADALCAACATDLPRLPPACPRCAQAIDAGLTCGHCLAHPPRFDATCAPFLYAFPIDRLIHTYKYGGNLVLARWFAERLVETLGNRRFDLIIPMPLHPARLRERGFNQSAELARHLGKQMKIPVDVFSCQRQRATPPQAALPHKKRAANVRGAFECVRSYDDKNILLVDDVMTTGASANECARTLKLHGAASITIAVVARTLKDQP